MAGAVITAALALAACGTDNNTNPPATGGPSNTASAPAFSCASGNLTAQGSSAQKNAVAQWINEYTGQCSGAKIDYQATSSGAGVTAFEQNQATFVGSDSALTATDQPKADARCGAGNKAINLPMVIGPIAVVYNVSGVTNLQLSPSTLAKIFATTIKTWNDPAIKADNPGATLPATAILPVHRGDSSGTSDNFTKYLTAAAGSDWTFGHNKVWAAPGGSGQSGSDGVSNTVKTTDGAIGYVELSFANLNSLNTAKIKNANGEFTQLTPDAAAKTVAGATVKGTGNDLTLSIDYNTKAPGAYPIVLVTYEIVCEKGTPADALPLLKSFLTYAATTGQTTIADPKFGYAPLPTDLAAKVKASISNLS
jgi:phosphate transport system substrate-binding protein